MRRILIPALCLANVCAVAQNAMSADRLDEYIDSISRHFDLGEVVVTGTRTPKFLKDTPIQTRVITSREIEKTDATNIQDLLQQELPGVEFSYAMNQQTHLNFLDSADRAYSSSSTGSGLPARRWTMWTSPVSIWTTWNA